MDNNDIYKIYLFNVTFQDSTDSKERPIVTIAYNQNDLSFELLGIFSDKPKYFQNPYYQDFMYPVQDYQAAGLKKFSWINVKYLLIVPFTALMGKESFGKLSEQDAKGLIDFYNQYWHNY